MPESNWPSLRASRISSSKMLTKYSKSLHIASEFSISSEDPTIVACGFPDNPKNIVQQWHDDFLALVDYRFCKSGGNPKALLRNRATSCRSASAILPVGLVAEFVRPLFWVTEQMKHIKKRVGLNSSLRLQKSSSAITGIDNSTTQCSSCILVSVQNFTGEVVLTTNSIPDNPYSQKSLSAMMKKVLTFGRISIRRTRWRYSRFELYKGAKDYQIWSCKIFTSHTDHKWWKMDTYDELSST